MKKVTFAGSTIYESMFEGCVQIQKVDCLEQCSKIEARAFYGCTALQEIDCFSQCINIGERAFYGCTALRDIVFSKYIKSIGAFAFASSGSGKSITFQSREVPKIGENAFSQVTGEVHYPRLAEWESVKENYGGNLSWIGYDMPAIVASGDCSNSSEYHQSYVKWTLTEDGVMHIWGRGDMANYDEDSRPWKHYIKNIKQIIFQGISDISAFAFKDAENLEEIEFKYLEPGMEIPPEDDDDAQWVSMGIIGQSAFENCTSLTSVSLSLRLLEENAFKGCTGLKYVRLENMFSAGPGGFENCTALEEVFLDSCVPADSLFKNCTNLRKVTFSNFEIEDYAQKIYASEFEGCVKLETLIPNRVRHVDERGFKDCAALKEITIAQPDNNLLYYFEIKDSAFKNCSGLKTINFSAIRFPEVSDTAFSGVTANVYYSQKGLWAENTNDYGGLCRTC